MYTKDVRSTEDRCHVAGQRRIPARKGWGDAELLFRLHCADHLAEKPLSRQTYKQRTPQLVQRSELSQEREVLRTELAKGKARVEHDGLRTNPRHLRKRKPFHQSGKRMTQHLIAPQRNHAL